jgi:hypothetical protein
MELNMKLSAKQKMLNVLSKKDGYNTFTVAQARHRFGITNVAARIAELREDGHPIYTNTRKLEDGRKISFYRLGTPTKRMLKAKRTFA